MARRRRRRRTRPGTLGSEGRPVSASELLSYPPGCACRLFYSALSEPMQRVTEPSACGQCETDEPGQATPATTDTTETPRG